MISLLYQQIFSCLPIFTPMKRPLLQLFLWTLIAPALYAQSYKDPAFWKPLIYNRFDGVELTAGPAMRKLDSLPELERAAVINKLQNAGFFPGTAAGRARLYLLQSYCNQPPEDPAFTGWKYWARKALNEATGAGDEFLLQSLCQYTGMRYFAEGNYDTCIFYMVKSIEMAESLGYKKTMLGNMKVVTSSALYNTHNYRETIAYCRDALIDPDSLPPIIVINGLNNLGLAFQRTAQYDSAIFYFEKLVKLAEEQGSFIWVGLAKGNIGDVLYTAGKEEEAIPYWQADYDSSMKYGEKGNAILTLAYLSRYAFRKGDQAKAIQQLNWSMANSGGFSINTYLHICKILAECYEKMGRSDSANYYYRIYFQKNDSINQIISRNNYNLVRMRLDYDKSQSEIRLVKKEKQAEIIRRNFLLGLLVLAIILAILFYNRQRLKMKLSQQAHEMARAEAEAARNQLEIFTQTLLEKNEQIEALSQSLEKQQVTHTDELVHQTLLTDYDWNRFKELFEKIHPEFFDKLKSRAPAITTAEMRLASLIRLRLDNKQMASMQGISLSGLRATKTRLRQKLQIGADEDLEDLILAL